MGWFIYGTYIYIDDLHNIYEPVARLNVDSFTEKRPYLYPKGDILLRIGLRSHRTKVKELVNYS